MMDYIGSLVNWVRIKFKYNLHLISKKRKLKKLIKNKFTLKKKPKQESNIE